MCIKVFFGCKTVAKIGELFQEAFKGNFLVKHCIECLSNMECDL